MREAYEICGGNTFKIKEDLKAHRCKENSQNKTWTTQPLTKHDTRYKMLKSLTSAVGAEMYPVSSNNIQKILRGEE